jgi:uncharacterized protein
MSDGGLGSATDQVTPAGSLAHVVDEYRQVRGEIERSILPLATSVDGRQFTFQASLHNLQFQTGGYVVLEAEGGRRLGQVLTMRTVSETGQGLGLEVIKTSVLIRFASGEGVILDGDSQPFHDAIARPAESGEVDAWLESTRPDRSLLTIGGMLLAPGVAAALDAGGFNRHTFMCGQSGSGKTYSLGLVLEQLLLGTSLRIVILDPNSDYIRLAEVRENADPAVAAEYAAAASGVAVWQNDPGVEHPLQVQFMDIDPTARAAVLGLDPIRDREEYAALAGILAGSEEGHALITGPESLLSSNNPDTRRLGLRAANLGVFEWSVWSRGRGRSLVKELVEPTSRCLVIDLGSLDTINEQRLISETVLSTLWRNRSHRQPCLIVIDEAHNVCPSQPADAVTALATSHASLIAAEGRKFGLYLLTSTQRPLKVHDEVLSQCDNLLLMRMNSEADLGHLRDAFSFVPAGLIARATTFRQGESLVAGKFVPHPMYVRFGQRLSQEGGADIPTSWAAAH